MSNSNKQTPNRNEIIIKTGTTLLQSAKEGLGLGLGVGLAQRAVSAIFGSTGTGRDPTEYEQCLIDKRDIGLCAHLLKKE